MDKIEILKKINHLNELKEKIELLKKYQPKENIILKSTAIIIEPRKHKALEFVIKNILENLNDYWNVQIFHGNLNGEFLEEIIKTKLSKYNTRITLIKLDVNNLNSKEYSSILLDKDFISNIPTETFLVFQTDSMINPNYKDLIHTFLKYDYVGAPWKNGVVGNGGFSLRKKSKILECIQNVPPNISYEDKWFSDSIHNLYKPPYELASLFSMETVYTKVFFAVHNAWVYSKPDEVEEMCKNCPGLKELIELQETFN